ncbi:MAG: 6-carboxytetrahydropterin synthase [Bacteroidetes bacterium]|nr:6-carboxytetrahydropterin synthase [Bacteroidota bacterium]
MNATVFRREHFNAAHRLHNPEWDEETNRRIFGKCNNPNFHGHNYLLEVAVKGPIDNETGYVIDMKILRDIIREEVTERYDHKNLNLDTADFKTLNPTAENIAAVIWNRISGRINNEYKLTVRLYETERNFVEFTGE